VTFDIDANGILNVTAQDKATGRQQRIQITASTNLSESEVERMVEEARRHEGEDQRRRELIQVRNEADQLLYSVEKTTRELGDRLRLEDRQQVETLTSELQLAVQSEDTQRIRQAMERLQQVTYALSQQLYQTGQQPGPGDSTGDGRSGRDEGEDVVEGEFEQL
jgi:molecular chaperone DnaK